MKKFTFQLITAVFFLIGKTIFAQSIDFKQDTLEGCSPLTVKFTYIYKGTGTDTAERVDWYFGDGNSASTTLPVNTVTHTYNTAGYYNTYIFVYAPNNNYIDQTYSSDGGISVIGAPTINSPDSTCSNETVYFQPDGPFTSASWDFGDGTTSSDSYPGHKYTTLGAKTVKLTAVTICGTFTVTKVIYVTTLLTPSVSINMGTNGPICPNYPLSFYANNYFTYNWNFGDGTTSTQQGPSHTYTTVGTKTVTLTVTNGCGNFATAIDSVIVANGLGFPSGVSVGNYSNVVCPGEEAQGYINGASGYPKYIWNFGDGSPLDSTSGDYYRHKFFAVGTYTVSCKVINHCGKDSTFSKTTIVSNNVFFPNQSWFHMDITSTPSCPNSYVELRAPGNYNNYEWNYGDGSPLTTTNYSSSNHKYGTALTTYTVSVKITNLCGKDTTLFSTVTIKNPAAFPNNSNFRLEVNTSPSCPNSNLSFYAPYGYPSYEWNFGDGTPLVSSTNSGYNHTYGNATSTYTVSVKITNTCGNDTTLYSTVIISGSIPFPTDSWFKLDGGQNSVCPGDLVQWYAPYGYISYAWDFGDGKTALSSRSSTEHNYLSVGNYTASVKITDGCGKDTTISATIVINNSSTFSSNLYLDASVETSVCPNDLIDFRFGGGTFKSYFWNFGDGDTLTTSGGTIQHSYQSTGVYYVSCKVKNGCGNSIVLNKTVQITNNTPINSSLSVKGVQNPSCMGDKVFFTMGGGEPSHTYVWNFGDGSPTETIIGTGASHVYLSNGTYTVSVKATNGCGLSKTITMTEIINNSVIPTLKDDNGSKNWGVPTGDDKGGITTAGCSNDAIIFYFMGSAANNLWDFGDGNTGTATESMMVYGGDGGGFPVTIIKHMFANNGQYKIKLTLTNNCGNSVTDSMMINIGGNQVVNGELTTSPPPYTTCASVDFLAFGGSTYGWNFGDGSPVLNTSSPTISHTFSSQGVYLITVLVTNGCGNTATYSRSVNVNGVGGPAVLLSSSVNPTCVSNNDGSATISVSSGQPPYTYSWNDANAQTTATATGLSAGLYDVTVTDDMGCASDLAVQINDPASIVLNFSKTNAGCGLSNASATVSVTSGGAAPFSYQWSTGATGVSASALSAGGYSVVVTDNSGCTSASSVSISENGGATVALNTSTNISCNGGTNGAIDINVSGSNPPYTYLWSNGATVQDPGGLSAGNYSVQVLDNSGCKSTLNTSLMQPTAVIATTYVSKAPTCGNFDGNASASASGGTGPYTYLWDSNAADQTTQTATGLPAGSYTVTITDTQGCTMDGEVSLSNSNAPNITAVVSDVNCNGGSNGAVNVTVTGGTSPYMYTWNVAPPNTNHQDLTNLLPGNYFLFVNDAKGCMSFRNYTIAQPDVLTTIISATGATCSTNNGTATANVSGGNSPYSYLWTGAQATQTATGLSTGSYTVTVTDSKGCTSKATTSIAVTIPTPNICMVTVDDASINNIIYWDKTQYQQVDSFIVYREVSTGVYKRIGAVKDTALSQFTDVNRSVGPANGDPNVGSYRYKLQMRDSCGNYSALSPYHNNIYILDIGAGQFSWSIPYTIESALNPVTNYNLICDLANLDNWFTVGSVAGTQSSVTDPLFLSRPATARWRISTDWSITCTPTRGSISTTRSNIKASGVATSISGNAAAQLLIYPNPASEMVTIQYPAGYKKYQLQVFDALGQLMYNEQLSSDGTHGMITKQLDVSTFRKGIYLINIQTENGNTYNRVAIQ